MRRRNEAHAADPPRSIARIAQERLKISGRRLRLLHRCTRRDAGLHSRRPGRFHPPARAARFEELIAGENVGKTGRGRVSRAFTNYRSRISIRCLPARCTDRYPRHMEDTPAAKRRAGETPLANSSGTASGTLNGGRATSWSCMIPAASRESSPSTASRRSARSDLMTAKSSALSRRNRGRGVLHEPAIGCGPRQQTVFSRLRRRTTTRSTFSTRSSTHLLSYSGRRIGEPP